MAAATKERNTAYRSGEMAAFPAAASTRIFAGTLVCLDGGYAVPAATSATLSCVGVAMSTVDNREGASGDLVVTVRRGWFHFGNSSAGDAITLAEVGATCYLVDDQTVAKTHATNTRSAAGIVRDVDAEGVWVEV